MLCDYSGIRRGACRGVTMTGTCCEKFLQTKYPDATDKFWHSDQSFYVMRKPKGVAGNLMEWFESESPRDRYFGESHLEARRVMGLRRTLSGFGVFVYWKYLQDKGTSFRDASSTSTNLHTSGFMYAKCFTVVTDWDTRSLLAAIGLTGLT